MLAYSRFTVHNDKLMKEGSFIEHVLNQAIILLCLRFNITFQVFVHTKTKNLIVDHKKVSESCFNRLLNLGYRYLVCSSKAELKVCALKVQILPDVIIFNACHSFYLFIYLIIF